MTGGTPVDKDGTGVASARHDHRTCRHEWRFVSDEVDDFGRIRMYECRTCGDVHFT